MAASANLDPHRRRRIVVLGLVLGVLAVVVCVALAYCSGALYETGVTPCMPPPGVLVDGGVSAIASVWEDVNGDGAMQPGEGPLEGILVGLGPGCEAGDIAYEGCALTDRGGRARVSGFRAGCPCRCWRAPPSI